VSYTFWTGITGYKMAAGVTALVIAQLTEMGASNLNDIDAHWLALAAFYISFGHTAGDYTELIRKYQISTTDALSKEQKDKLTEVGQSLHSLKRQREEILSGQRKARAKFKKDMEILDDLIGTFQELEAPYREFTSTLSGSLTHKEKQELHTKYRNMKTKAESKGEEVAPFDTILTRAQEAKRARSKAQINTIFRGLNEKTQEAGKRADKAISRARDLLGLYAPEESMDVSNISGASDDEEARYGDEEDLFDAALDN
jgi:hypothetical protein